MARPDPLLAWPPSSSRSTSSSLSSTFSDLHFTAHPSPPQSSSGSKTNAFFASPFTTRPPSPNLPPKVPPKDTHPNSAPPRSLTADFFATPVKPPSPPPAPPHSAAATSSALKGLAAIHPARIFPSRYRRARDPIELDDNDDDLPKKRTAPVVSGSDGNNNFLLPSPFSHHDRAANSSSGSDPGSASLSSSYSSTSSLDDTRLPTPPRSPRSPPRPLPPTSLSHSTSSTDATPRPPSIIPHLNLFPQPQDGPVVASPISDTGESAPAPGSIISSSPHEGGIWSPHPSPLQATFFLHSPEPDLQLPSANSAHSGSTVHVYDESDRTHTPRTHTPTPSTAPTSASSYTKGNDYAYGTTHTTSLRLLRPLGQGAFSSVWLAEDMSPTPLVLSSKQSVRDLRRAARVASGSSYVEAEAEDAARYRNGGNEKDADKDKDSRTLLLPSTDLSLSRSSSLRKFRDRIQGTRPPHLLGRKFVDERHGEMGVDIKGGAYPFGCRFPSSDTSDGGESDAGGLSRASSLKVGATSLSRASSLTSDNGHGGGAKKRTLGLGKTRLVAVKMTPRGNDARERERTRVGFVREVEVLRHVSHPNITPLLAHLSTSSHHVLVLPYLPGGDLLGLVNDDIAWGKLTESVMRRIWCELCKAVGWMHGVGLVHRDIKLENILLTTPAFTSLTPSSPRPTLSDLPFPPSPLVKLTDFGLSRFVEIDEDGNAERLSTRCGSEAYAAPELVMGGSGSNGGPGVYDARETDAWACGVVLYALVAKRLPFGESTGHDDGQGKIGGERVGWEDGRRRLKERRAWLMKIAAGEWTWPVIEPGSATQGMDQDDQELVGGTLVRSEGAQRIVRRLLVRNPRKRARIGELWDDEWMRGGAMGEEVVHFPSSHTGVAVDDSSSEVDVNERDFIMRMLGEDEMGEDLQLDGQGGDDDDDDEEEDGLLLDQEGIDNIARREVVYIDDHH